MKIAIAMSGGVDSSVAAKILKDDGHDLVGLFLKLWSDPASTCDIQRENRCCNFEALEDARMVAAKLKIPFYVINAKKEFKKKVVDYFLEEYKNLRTPNPCIVCNEKIKFDLLLKKALSIGCEKLATGHYARIVENNSGNLKFKIKNLKLGNFHLLKGIDGTKDQSYMLYRLNQDQLGKIIFPLRKMKKLAVRKLAVKWNLPVKEKPESQEICFFADRDYRTFLQRYLGAKFFQSGDIIGVGGEVIGKHQGLVNYTVGQRKLVNNESRVINHGDKNPLYVVGFNTDQNQLIVGEDKEVYKKEMTVGNVSWIDSGCHPEPIRQARGRLVAGSIKVKIRYRHPEMPCKVKKDGNKLVVKFQKPQRAITPGQSAVFYLGDEVIGGGVIEK